MHDTGFTNGRTISTTTDDNNGKSTIPRDSNEKHYYYGYSIPRQLLYIFLWQWLSERNQGSTSDTSEGGGAGGAATPVLLSGEWIGIPSKIGASCLSAANVLRSALVTR